jgi:hypothetical protein
MKAMAIALLLAGATVFAQGFATLSGTVVDPQGALLPATTMVLTNSGTGAKYEVRTDRTGHFEFVGLPGGGYQLEARLPGFRTGQDSITVAGRDLIRNLTLQVGQLEETITVSADGGPARVRPASDADRTRFQEVLAKCTPAAASAAPAIGGNIKPPLKIGNANPAYPENLRLAGIGGVVKLEARIGVDGRIKEVQPVANQTIDPGFVAAATDAVNQWEFTSTLLNCVPVEVDMTVSVYFNPAR